MYSMYSWTVFELFQKILFNQSTPQVIFQTKLNSQTGSEDAYSK